MGSDDRDTSASAWRALLAAAPGRDEGLPLALGVDLLVRSRDGSPWAPRRLTPATARSADGAPADLVLGVRPMVPGASPGSWVKGDASWDAVRRPGDRFAARPARWFAELHSIARELRTLATYSDLSDWLVLDTIESTLLFPHLARAAGLGIPLVGVRPRTAVRLEPGADAVVTIDRHAGAALSVAVDVRIAGEQTDAARTRAVGRHGVYAHGFRGGRLEVALAPVELGETAHRILTSAGRIVVPASDTEEFLTAHAPRLARREAVRAGAGVVVPEAARPVLAVEVAHRAADEVEVALSWEYAGLDPMPFAPEPGSAERDAPAEARVRGLVVAVWTDACGIEPAARQTLRDMDAADFCTRVLPALAALDDVRVVTRGVQAAYRELAGVPEITVTAVETTDADWFDLGFVVTIDGRRIPFADLFIALSMRRRRMMLSDGASFSLAHPALDRLRALIDESADVIEWEAGPRISRHQLALWEDFEDLADESVAAIGWRRTVDGLRDVDAIPETPLPDALRADLRPYQRRGLDWLAFLWTHRLGGILADDMGLGKTLQTLALLAHAREQGERRPFLVVAPTSVVGTWREEAARFTPGLRVHIADTTSARSARPLPDTARGADVVVTSYAVLRLDEDAFAGIDWGSVVLDEAQYVKNPATRVHRAVAGLRADTVFALTGTPVENSLTDLWALLSLTAPGLFPSPARFRRDYIGPIEEGKVPENAEGGPFRQARLARLRRRIRPFVLRRTKERVAAELPRTQEQVLHVELSPAHRAVYDTVLQRERQKVLGLLADLDRHRFIVFRSLTLLRMLSLAPELVDAGDTRIRSAKVDTLVAHVRELAAEGHRALVFSQFTSFLDIVQRRLAHEGIAFERLDGSTRRRDAVVSSFRAGDAPVFLVSLKAGGVGLTITEADYVFLLDPWWNPAAESQAIDRTHRIGQSAQVFVYRLVAAGTIEEKVLALQQRKARLIEAVMDDDDLLARALSPDDVRELFTP